MIKKLLKLVLSATMIFTLVPMFKINVSADTANNVIATNFIAPKVGDTVDYLSADDFTLEVAGIEAEVTEIEWLKWSDFSDVETFESGVRYNATINAVMQTEPEDVNIHEYTFVGFGELDSKSGSIGRKSDGTYQLTISLWYIVGDDSTIDLIDLTYNPDGIDLNTAWTEGEVNTRVRGYVNTKTTGTKINTGNTYLMYKVGTDSWYGVGNGSSQVDASKTYAINYSLNLDSNFSWISTVTSDSVSGITVRINGNIVTSDCTLRYTGGLLRVTCPIGSASTTPRVKKISISDASMSMEKGGSHTFSGEVTGTVTDTSINWSVEGATSSSTVMNASTGTLTIGKDETAETLTVKATASADSTKTASITITVVDELPYISSVTVSSTESVLYPNDTAQMSATVEGTQTDKSVTWSVEGNTSSDTTITSAGKLTIGPDETASSVTVRAIANKDTTKQGTTTITIHDLTRISELDLIYNPEPIDLNTAWTEGQVNSRVSYCIGTTTTGTSINAGNSFLMYRTSADSWFGVGEGKNQIDASKTYGIAYCLNLDSGYGWVSTVNTSSVSGLTVRVNGVNVTSYCTLKYVGGLLRVYYPIGSPSSDPTVTGVTISDSDMTLDAGETYTFSGSVSGTVTDTSINWSVEGAESSKTVIDASTGKLTVGSDETASSFKVVATANADSKKTASVKVTVPPYISSVSISPNNCTMALGGKRIFIASVSGTQTDKSVTWSVEGNTSSSTTIDQSGYLKIAEDETAATLTVKVVADKDTTKQATATITVTYPTRVSELDLTYNASAIDFNTYYLEMDMNNTVKNNMQETTDGVTMSTSKSCMKYTYGNAGNWWGITDYNQYLSYNYTYGIAYVLDVEDGYDWVATAKSSTISGLTIKVNGVDVTSQCKLTYDTANNEVEVIYSLGNPKRHLSRESITVSYDSTTYNGTELKPTVDIYGLIQGTDWDYTVSYSNNVNVGTATVTITGVNKCTGTVTRTFTITPKDVSTLSVDSIANCTYNGQEQKPTLVVKDGTKTLVNGTDYTVSYSNNINPGTATATITGIGNYQGTKDVTFTIEQGPQIDIGTFELSFLGKYIYVGSSLKPAVTINGLVEGTDYTVTYPEDTTNVGTKTVIVTGIGNYTGTNQTTYTIFAADIDKVTLSATSYTYNGKVHYPTVNVYCENEKLVKGQDYTTNTYTSNKKPGTYTITVTGKGNYTGTLKKTYKINVKATTMKSLTKGTKSFTAKWTKQTSTYISGYQIQYSTSSKFTSAKTVTVSSYKTTSKTIKSLKAKKKYYVRVRTYKTISGKKYYSAWSKSKYVTTK